ncbi:MAG: DUF89 family protein [Phycisphaerae bacterium]|nr:DUF89 family protein [Phycisphaerae bacterium]
MKTYIDCISCFIKQAIEVGRLVSDDEIVHHKLIRKVVDRLRDYDFQLSPPEMGQYIYEQARLISGVKDPYKKQKKDFNHFATELYDEFHQAVTQSADPVRAAILLAISGNIIDFGTGHSMDHDKIDENIRKTIAEPLDDTVLTQFKEQTASAEKILYIADNAGEIVFDKLLIELLPTKKITVVVRGGYIINDVTMQDAIDIGLTDIVTVIDNGDNSPGCVLDRCSDQFKQALAETDMVIAKGQGNFESLENSGYNIFFLLKAKCSVLAKHIGVKQGSIVFRK